MSASTQPVQTRYLRYLGAVLAVIVALVHFMHPRLGFQRLLLYVEVGTLFDPRPLLFTLSALAIFGGMLLAYNEVYVRAVYVAGIALMLVFLVGYGAWHTVLEHGGFWPHLPAHAHEDRGFIEIMIAHLRADRWAVVSKFAEVTLVVILAALLILDSER